MTLPRLPLTTRPHPARAAHRRQLRAATYGDYAGTALIAAVTLFALLPAGLVAANKATNGLEAEVRRLVALGQRAEDAGNLPDARTQYLAAEQLLYSHDAEQGLQRV